MSHCSERMKFGSCTNDKWIHFWLTNGFQAPGTCSKRQNIRIEGLLLQTHNPFDTFQDKFCVVVKEKCVGGKNNAAKYAAGIPTQHVHKWLAAYFTSSNQAEQRCVLSVYRILVCTRALLLQSKCQGTARLLFINALSCSHFYLPYSLQRNQHNKQAYSRFKTGARLKSNFARSGSKYRLFGEVIIRIGSLRLANDYCKTMNIMSCLNVFFNDHCSHS